MSKFDDNFDTSSVILTRPRISEKATFLSNGSGARAYTLEVSRRANKPMIEKAVGKIFKVKPTRVNIINTKPKIVFRKGKKGIVSGTKKAIVFLKKGEKIEII